MSKSNRATIARDSMIPLKSEKNKSIQSYSGNSKGDNNE